MILFSPHTRRPAKAGGFTACHPDCLEDAPCPHLSRGFRCSPGAQACKLISENVKGLSSLIKCKICLTACRSICFSREADLNYKVRLPWCGERVVRATGRLAPPLGKPDSKELHEKPREEASVLPYRRILHCKTKQWIKHLFPFSF